MLNKPLRITLIAAAALAAGTAARAEGLYVGGALGAPDYHSSINGIGTGHGSGVSARLFGGYDFSPYLAVEGGAFSLGKISDDTGNDAKGYGLDVRAVGRYEFTPGWAVLGEGGLAEARFTTTQGNGSSPGAELGAGLEWSPAKQVSVRLTYDRYHFTSVFSDHVNVGQYLVGVKFGF